MNKKSYLLRSTLIAALGGLLFGFDTAVISGAEGRLEDIYKLTKFWLGFTMASALVGTIVGAVIAGRPADRLGRRPTLMAIALLYFISAVGCGLAWDWYSLVFFRFIGGIGVGGASVVSPMYVAEISPARYRGRLVALTQFNIVFGILLAFFSNYLISQFDLGLADWRWMFGVEGAPAAAFFALLFLTPRSPRWLVAHGRVDEARSVFRKLGTDDVGVDDEIREIQASLDLSHHSLREPFFRKAYMTPILLVVAIAAFNQLSGINAVLYYSKRIFLMAGAGEDAALLSSVGLGFANLVFTMAALAVIDHFGRKKLMIVGSIGYILSLAATSWAFYTYGAEFNAAAEAEAAGQVVEVASTGSAVVLIGLMVFIASHAFGQGAVIWVFISEIFPNRVRARGQALGSFTHWILCAAISWTFPMIAKESGGHAFAFFAIMMVFQLIWVIRVMPETKGVPLEQIQKQLGIE